MEAEKSEQPISSQRDLRTGERLLGEGWKSDAKIPHRLVEEPKGSSGSKIRRVISIPGLKP